MSINTLTTNPVILSELSTALQPSIRPYIFLRNTALTGGSINTYTILNQNVPIKAGNTALITATFETPTGLTTSGSATCVMTVMTVSGQQIYDQQIYSQQAYMGSTVPTCNVFTSSFTPDADNPAINVTLTPTSFFNFDTQDGFASVSIIQ